MGHGRWMKQRPLYRLCVHVTTVVCRVVCAKEVGATLNEGILLALDSLAVIGDNCLFVLLSYERTDQQREARADVLLAVDFLQQEYVEQLGANYTEVSSIPLLLARLRQRKYRQRDPANPEVVSRDPAAGTPAANSIVTTPPLRHWRRRRLRRDGIQPPDSIAVTSIPPDSRRASVDLQKSTGFELVKLREMGLTTEIASTAKDDGNDENFDEIGEKLVDEREDYAERLLKIAHGLHYGSIAILGIFVIQVRISDAWIS